MTKLDDAITRWEEDGCIAPTQDDMITVLKAAQQYAALLKLAPVIAALVEAGEKATQGEMNVFKTVDVIGVQNTEHDFAYTTSDKGEVFFMDCKGAAYWRNQAEENAEFIAKAANTRHTLKAIHDNLTKFGKDTTDDRPY
jgi:hypothetical protein